MTMSRVAIAVALLFAAAPPVRGHDELPRTAVIDELSGIDFLPSRARLDQILSGDVATLRAVADDDSASMSPGVRIRAYRSLGLFDEPAARTGLTEAINRYRNSDEPLEQLYLIAALEALGDIGGAADVPTLGASLSHDKRDVRAAAARALGTTRVQTACGLLQTQRRQETRSQVILIIDDALRSLGPPCSIGPGASE